MSFTSTPESVLFYEGSSFHVRPGHWKFREKINMILVELDLQEDIAGDDEDILAYVGRVPDRTFPTMPPGAVEFRGLTCPILFDGCLALTVPPSKAKGTTFHYSPLSLFLFYVDQSDGGTRIVHYI